MKNDQEEAYEKVLSSTLDRIIEFNKFAEAKNAALLTFSSAWIFACVKLLYGATPVSNPDWAIVLKCALPTFTVGAVISFSTFLPRLRVEKFHRDPERQKSLLYFGDVATFAPAAYKERLERHYWPDEEHSATQSYLDDLAIQIAINSSIAVKKFRNFNVGGIIVLIGISSFLYPPAKAFVTHYFAQFS